MLLVICGGQPGESLRVRVVGGELEVTGRNKGLVYGRIMQWRQVGVITGLKRDGRTSYRYWLLEPPPATQSSAAKPIELAPFRVEGAFVIREQRRDKAASAAFAALGRAEPAR